MREIYSKHKCNKKELRPYLKLGKDLRCKKR